MTLRRTSSKLVHFIKAWCGVNNDAFLKAVYRKSLLSCHKLNLKKSLNHRPSILIYIYIYHIHHSTLHNNNMYPCRHLYYNININKSPKFSKRVLGRRRRARFRTPKIPRENFRGIHERTNGKGPAARLLIGPFHTQSMTNFSCVYRNALTLYYCLLRNIIT